MTQFYEYSDEQALRIMLKSCPSESLRRVFEELRGRLGDEPKAIRALKAENLFASRRFREFPFGPEFGQWVRNYLVERNMDWTQESLELAANEYKVAHKC